MVTRGLALALALALALDALLAALPGAVWPVPLAIAAVVFAQYCVLRDDPN